MTDKKMPESLRDFEAAFRAGEAHSINEAARAQGVEVLALPEGYRLESLEVYGAVPARKRGEFVFVTERSFNAYVSLHKTTARSRIYADLEATTAVCVLDDHAGVDGVPEEALAAGFGEHRARFVPPLDPDWRDWTKHNDDLLPQLKFAQFVEDHIPNILEPDGAELLELVQDLSMTSDVKFKSSKKLQSGAVSLVLQEEPKNKLGRDGFEMPGEIKLRLPVFRRGEPVDLVARTRWRLIDGNLALGYHLDRPHDVVDRAFLRMMVDGVQVETGLDVLWGKPPAAGAALGK